jgi:RNA polymerase sigma-70 factor (ECF subfamily)
MNVKHKEININNDNNENSDNSNDNIQINHNFYEKYDSQIRAIVARILKQANKTQDIDDCVNTIYLDLMNKLEQYNDTRGSMAAFVTVVARSAALNYCKSNMRKISELIGDDKLDFLAEPIEYENEVEFNMLVENILEKLNKKERVLFTMRYMYFYSPEEIAKTMQINRSAVDMRVNRLKKKIKHFLTKGGIII